MQRSGWCRKRIGRTLPPDGISSMRTFVRAQSGLGLRSTRDRLLPKPEKYGNPHSPKEENPMTVAESITSQSIARHMLAEFEEQAALTRKFLERLPEDKLTWKPHAKSMTAGQLAYHLALVPGGVAHAAAMNPAPAPDFNALAPQPASRQE